MTKKTRMPISNESLRLAELLRGRLEGITDQHTRTLTASWARAWDDVAPDLSDAIDDLLAAARDGRVSRAQAIRAKRLNSSLQHIAAQLKALGRKAGVTITADVEAAVLDTTSTTARIIAAQMPPGHALAAKFDLVSTDAIDAIVERSTKQITSLARPLSADATQAVRRELVRSVAVGDNPKVTAARMLQRTQGSFNGGLTRALTISRTEIMDAHRAGAKAQDLANSAVTGWVWLSALTERTCPACIAQHGSEHPVDETGPAGHQNCRCTRQPKTASWRDLGFDIDEPDSVIPDAEQWFTDLSTDQQRSILGKHRYDAWSKGEFPMDQWAVKKTNPGWRDSYVPAPAPKAAA